MKISLLCPTRKRPDFVKEYFSAVLDTASNINNIEIVFQVDEDDIETIDCINGLKKNHREGLIILSTGKRVETMGINWNLAWEKATGEIFHMSADDLRFMNKGWDELVIQEFEKIPDRIILLWGDDIGTSKHYSEILALHGFIHKNWADALGRFGPGLVYGNDSWLTDVARLINRCVRNEKIVTKHMRQIHNPDDQTCKDMQFQAKRQNDAQKYGDLNDARIKDADKLQEFINNFTRNNQ